MGTAVCVRAHAVAYMFFGSCRENMRERTFTRIEKLSKCFMV